MKMSAQDIWKHITHLITLWEDPWSPQNCSKIPKWKMRVVSAWVYRVHCLGIKMIQFLFCVCLLQNVLYLNCLFDGPLI